MDRTRMKFVLGTMIVEGVLILASWYWALGWLAATVLTWVILLAILAFAVLRRDSLLLRLFAFGVVVGLGELPSDHFAVAQVGVLVYPQRGPFIWSSPSYMPASYVILMVQIGYLGYRAMQKWGLLRASIGTAVFGGLNVPAYEYLAKGADFWFYQNCRLLFGAVPWFTITSEILFCLPLPFVVGRIATGSWRPVIGWGVAQAVWIYIGCVAGWWLLH